MSSRFVRDVERGQTEPKIGYLADCAQICGVTPNWLTGFADEYFADQIADRVLDRIVTRIVAQ